MGFWRRGNYEFNTIEMIMKRIELFAYFKTGTWYVGITANPVQSLAAHGIDIYEAHTYECWDFPCESIKECKDTILAYEGCTTVTDCENDYLDNTYPNMYIYMFQLYGKNIPKIDISGFTPLKNMPKPPIIIKCYFASGKETIDRYDDSFDEKKCEGLLEEIRTKIIANQLLGLVIKPRGTHFMEIQLGEEGCIISYDSNTSQNGGFQSFRNERKSRKSVKLFTGEYPEYMICSNVDELMEIIGYFIKKDKKPGKRQNVKWVVMPGEKDVRIFCRRGRELY